ncbi:MAG TPA: heterodisulfide reductase-related iron-sulfur binding cluster [Nocardioides sp.]|uniref:heterodisulfide reductase-related iron-sulfur binding cluster n=1 Tax=Nocardioides sp. TaxID=35761 RepID=UPI002E3303B5|nr:heterodisulfide reductase-related iron-sulfur binding cluster [Nocardioides sp.]HEX3931987.1 heterodisulfide reductase-related iron-sulfur binding cluster [Nocardioides sp.]
MTAVLILGLLLNAIALPIAARRVLFLYRLITSGQPAPDRIAGVTGRLGAALKRQVVEVFGQRKLLKWSVPGAAHFFVFWAFLILGTVYLEAYVILLTRDPEWHWFAFGSWSVLGFVQDFIAVMALAGIAVFWAIRLRNQPKQLGRRSRFFGSHLGPAYFTLFMIFNVVWTLFLFRGAVEARDAGTGHGYGRAAFVSYLLGKVLPDSTALIGIGLLLHIGVMLAFLVFVLNSKHLHIFVAPLNVLFGRRPVALGAVKPLVTAGKAVTLADIEELDESARLGVGAISDFTWKGLLDFATCTECGRCQSQCPAWNTEKPLSPKLLIMNLRDHAMAAAPALLAGDSGGAPESAVKELERPLVGPEIMDGSAYGVIDPDVLWSCTSCGACVNQCPVDIEHVDHIVDMRRYQVLVENNFPSELNQLFRGLESKGNPWSMSAQARMDWAKGLDFDVPVVGEDLESLESVDWLFWIGCAGAYEDRAKKTVRAVAELLHLADVSFGVLGNGETCTGDPARRAGNEFVYQGLAAQNVETFQEYRVKQVVTTCPHCLNTLKNEYRDLGIELDVVHHTQLLNRLVREGRLTPVQDGAGAAKRSITYHDPCYLGRHNQVYAPPRELLQVLPGASYVEMERSAERSFCCGAGGARMWMEETIGERINVNRTREAVATGADQIAVGCPFCRVMLSDGLTSEQTDGHAREDVEVLDVAQMLLASVRGESATRTPAAPSAPAARSVETRAEPEPDDVTETADTVTATEDVGPAAAASSGAPSGAPSGASLFDLAEPATGAEPEERASEPGAAASESLFDLGETASAADVPSASEGRADDGQVSDGGSLFDVAGTSPASEASTTAPEATPQVEASTPVTRGSLFDLPASQTETRPEANPAPRSAESAEPTAGAEPAAQIPEGSLFDLPESRTDPAPPAPVRRSEEPAAPEQPPEEVQGAPRPGQATRLPDHVSLFDVGDASSSDAGAPTTPSAAEPPETEEPKPAPSRTVDLDESTSLFDL